MALRPKLEFYKFKLVSRDGAYKTFRDFAIDELHQRRSSSKNQIMKKLFDHFMNMLVTDMAKSNSIKKQLKLIKTKANKYFKQKPQVDINNNLVYGVINGGRYGRNGMMSDSSAEAEDANAFGKNKTILRYYYFLLYVPLDHNEGCFIIHSNSKEETITDIFKIYISRLFKGSSYKNAALFMFCPKSFQREFENESIIKSVEFSNTYLDDVYNEEGIRSHSQLYDVKIEIKPKQGNIKLKDRSRIQKLLGQLGYIHQNKDNEKLTSFKSKKMTLNSPFSKSNRTFDLDDDNFDLIPVVYLEDRIKNYNDDETPEFEELNILCQNLFKDEVLPEIRPDLYEQN